ncbi:hypothetical protein [Thermomonas sp.]|uniref:hypothetical protein n=1 Tax=Thermomonas sp. TaxID=1971895 RepID=UPI00262DB821|nr:hypothetical protein [Thermomonas sp.]
MSRNPFLAIASLAIVLPLTALAPPPVQAQAAANGPTTHEYRILLVGNSLIYSNNLPAMLRAIGEAQGTPLVTRTFAAPGGKLSDRASDGFASAELGRGHYDAILLQEQGGNLAVCVAGSSSSRKAPCAASMRAYETFAKLAHAQGARVLLFSTWGPDRRWDQRTARSVGMIARKVDGQLFNAAEIIDTVRRAQPNDNPLPDGIHPNIHASLALALALYRDITGTTPVARDLRIRAPLYPANIAVTPDRAIEEQAAIAGDGKVTVVPAALIAPIIESLPPASHEAQDSRHRP